MNRAALLLTVLALTVLAMALPAVADIPIDASVPTMAPGDRPDSATDAKVREAVVSAEAMLKVSNYAKVVTIARTILDTPPAGLTKPELVAWLRIKLARAYLGIAVKLPDARSQAETGLAVAGLPPRAVVEGKQTRAEALLKLGLRTAALAASKELATSMPDTPTNASDAQLIAQLARIADGLGNTATAAAAYQRLMGTPWEWAQPAPYAPQWLTTYYCGRGDYASAKPCVVECLKAVPSESMLSAYLPGNDQAQIAFLPAQQAVDSYKFWTLHTTGHLPANADLTAIAGQLVNGGAARPFVVSDRATDLAATVATMNFAGSDWLAALLAGNVQTAAQIAQGHVTNSTSDSVYQTWAARTSRSLAVYEQCYNGSALVYLQWMNGDVPNPPVDWLTAPPQLKAKVKK